MPVHFSASEMSARKQRLLAAMAARKLDGLLLFAQESHYWLTGYDSFGFCFFQCLYVGADGRVALLTRSPDLRQAQRTSNIEDIRIWKDGDGADPTHDLRAMLEDLGARGRFGVEFDSYGLTHFNGRRLEAALEGYATLVDASSLVAASADDEIGRRDRLCPRGGAPFRSRRPRGDRRDPAGRRRRRHSGGDAQRDLRRRRRLSRQRIHHRFGRRRAALPLQERPAQALPPTIRSRSNSPASAATITPRSCAPMSSAGPSRCTRLITPPRSKRCWPARPSSGRAEPRATSSPPMRAFSTRIAFRAIASTPAAIRSARNSRPPGWTRRCFTSATIFSSRAIRSISCT